MFFANRLYKTRVIAALMLMSLMSACSQEKIPQQNISPQTTKINFNDAKKEQTLRVVGSNTIGDHLGLELVKGYLKHNGYDVAVIPRTHEVKHVKGKRDNELLTVIIESSGSSTGFIGLDTNTANVAMASRKIKDKEVETLKEKYGDMTSMASEHVIALDGLAIIVHPENPVKNLSKKQVAEIFSGRLTNWKQAGGADLPIRPLVRDRMSGTLSMFKKLIMKPYKKVIPIRLEDFMSSDELAHQVALDKGAIGFVGTGSIGRTKALAIGAEKQKPLPPTADTIADEDYLLARRLYMYIPELSPEPQAKSFIEFVKSPVGKEIVKNSGMIAPKMKVRKMAKL